MSDSKAKRIINCAKYSGSLNIVEEFIKKLATDFAADQKWNLQAIKDNVIYLRTGISWKSWGDDIQLKYTLDPQNIVLEVVSGNFQVHSWKSNDKNIETIETYLIPKLEKFLLEKELERRDLKKADTTSEGKSISLKKTKDEKHKLSLCEDCGEEISWNSKSCPKCGAPNNLVHPMVKLVIHENSANQDIEFEVSGATITGKKKVVSRASVFKWSLSSVIFLIGHYLYYQMALLKMAAHYGGQAGFNPPIREAIYAVVIFFIIFAYLAKKLKIFKIDFSKMPPHWESNDDEFWKNIKEKYVTKNAE